MPEVSEKVTGRPDLDCIARVDIHVGGGDGETNLAVLEDLVEATNTVIEDHKEERLETDGGVETTTERLDAAVTRVRTEHEALGNRTEDLVELAETAIGETDEERERDAVARAVSKVLTAIWGHHPGAPASELEAEDLLRKLVGSFDEETVSEAVERAGWGEFEWKHATDGGRDVNVILDDESTIDPERTFCEKALCNHPPDAIWSEYVEEIDETISVCTDCGHKLDGFELEDRDLVPDGGEIVDDDDPRTDGGVPEPLRRAHELALQDVFLGEPEHLPDEIREELAAHGVDVPEDLDPQLGGLRGGLWREDVPDVVATILENVHHTVEIEARPSDHEGHHWEVEWTRVDHRRFVDVETLTYVATEDISRDNVSETEWNAFFECPACDETVSQWCVCPGCGFYDGKLWERTMEQLPDVDDREDVDGEDRTDG